MIGIELCQRVVDFHALAIWPRLLGKLCRRLDRDPATEGPRGQNQSATAARTAHDPATPRIEGSRFPGCGRLGAMDAAVERRRETQQREGPDLQTQESLFGRRTLVQRSQKPHRRVEHGRLGFVVWQAFTNHGERDPCNPNRLQAPEDSMKRAVDRHALQVRELTAAGSKVRVHENVRL